MWDTKRTRRGRVSHWSGPGGAEADIKYVTKDDDEHQVEPENRCRTSSEPATTVTNTKGNDKRQADPGRQEERQVRPRK
jgi:hypothetical protein